jgi:3-hydroxy acid dehydrogenase/malonic semialdehyde reductase
MKKIVMITGASSGFGESCAKRFAKEGWQLILIARRQKRLEKLKENLPNGKSIHILPLDIRIRELVQKGLSELPQSLKNIDVLINNAGIALGLEPAQKADLDDWETMIDTNIKGIIYLTRLVLPGMVERDWGHIVNIGSIAGSWPYPGGNVYGATKAFVKQFSFNLRTDLLGTAIRVTNIEPGMAETEFSIVRFKGDTERAANVYKGAQPLKGEDIAESIYWAVNLPPHVNINRIELMPTVQTWGPLKVYRK